MSASNGTTTAAAAEAILLAGRRVLVVGLGRSGLAAACLCAERGAVVTVTDKRPEAMLASEAAVLAGRARLELGGHRQASFVGAQLIVLSPGVPELPELRAARAAGVEVLGELELAARFVDAPVVAVTGTNGKSTVTTLVGAILEQTAARRGQPLFVGGNLGDPLANCVGTPAASPSGLVVCEVSSFQLETVVRFRPRVAVLLNITPDHLDRYPSFAAYAATKGRIFAAQGAEDHAIVNLDDPLSVEQGAAARSRRHGFSSTIGRERPKEAAAFLDREQLVLRLPAAEEERYPASELRLVGRHNLDNALAACLAARLAGASYDDARRAIRDYRALPHRMELIAEHGGVQFYDDSKGTNVGAVVKALDGFPRPVVLIAGGRDKGGDYRPLRQVLAGRARGLVLIGEAAPLIERALAGTTEIRRADSLPDAVRQARALARPGDAVVLSPACSSFDMFRDYQERAQVFRAAVEELRC